MMRPEYSTILVTHDRDETLRMNTWRVSQLFFVQIAHAQDTQLQPAHALTRSRDQLPSLGQRAVT
jgi:hypothetical protein